MSRRLFLGSSSVILGGCLAATARPARAAESAFDVGTEPQLFLDDAAIERIDGLRRVLHQPEKKGLIKNRDGSDWELGSVYLGNLVCRDAGGRFHMTYRYSWWDPSVRDLHPGIGNDKAHWFRETVGYATSADGIHWDKPRLGRVDGPTGFRKIAEFPFEVPAGMSRDNNLGCPIDFACDLNAHGNVADPARRFLLRVVRMEDTHPFAKPVESQMYYAARWPDLAHDRHWKDALTPVPKATLSPRGFRSLAGYDERAGEWFAVSQDVISNWLKHDGRDIARYSTKDMVHWRGPEPSLRVPPDESRDAKDWVEYMDMLAYRAGGRRSGAWLGQLVVFHSDRSNPQSMMPTIRNVWRKGTTELRLVVSRDAGRTWRPVAGHHAWLPCSDDPHGYDRLVFATYPIRVGDEAWFYYCGWNGDHLVFNRDGSLFEPGFLRTHRTARATLRWDGYLSLDAVAQGGSLVTRPLRFDGAGLVANLSAPAGRLRAELQDESGGALEGFALEDCQPARGDGLEIPLGWKGQPSLRKLAGRPLRLKLELAGGSLYGFRFTG